LFMPLSPSPITRSRRVKVRTTISGTLLVCSRKVKQLRVSGFPHFVHPLTTSHPHGYVGHV
jgi:hypothetical protein